jgi:2-oxoglutarate dehydrogenase E2 component (dihydrolipoamide succinyltransferase)
MSEFKILMPKLGESVQEATITKWFVKEGDKIEEDGALFEVATDKVDSEIPSPVDGIIAKIFFKEGDVVPVGVTVAVINLDGEESDSTEAIKPEKSTDTGKIEERSPESSE